jgi:hypothetical protein
LKKTNKNTHKTPNFTGSFMENAGVEVVNKQNRRLSGIVKYLKKEPAVISKTKYPPKTKKKENRASGGRGGD